MAIISRAPQNSQSAKLQANHGPCFALTGQFGSKAPTRRNLATAQVCRNALHNSIAITLATPQSKAAPRSNALQNNQSPKPDTQKINKFAHAYIIAFIEW